MESYTINDLTATAREIRTEIIKMVYSAKSGHPGGSLSIADVITALYFKEMNIDPEKPDKPDRDILIMSKGHASPAEYAALALRGYFPVELLEGFRKVNSKLEGHVHRGIPGVESSTGSLGQGLGVAIGFALSSKLDSKPNKIYAILGDGEMEEGNIWESLMAASKYHLGNLTAILDRNMIQLDGFTEDIMPLGNVAEKVAPFGWEVITINGNNMDEVVNALEYAKKPRDRPLFIVANTIKGKGVSYMENNPKYHGSPPANEEEYVQALKEIEGSQ
ncbi:transketolase [Ferroplasma acidiphilum]|uniref:transketolase n=1 Tax=Ferroplasma acidiphilum TaxID=74969 RepID=UPI00281694CB|nr:transketolase [Ferroplasma acidiphilum]WMT52443.1 MAG: transketolase [Ferroplasma acidiphilum]